MKHIKLYAVFAIFLSLVIYAAYLYSLRFDYLPWGSSKRDGLFFLAYYLIILPCMLVVAFVKNLILRGKSTFVLKNSFFFYLFMIALPSLDTHGSQFSLGLGITFCLITSVLILFEIMQIDNVPQ